MVVPLHIKMGSPHFVRWDDPVGSRLMKDHHALEEALGSRQRGEGSARRATSYAGLERIRLDTGTRHLPLRETLTTTPRQEVAGRIVALTLVKPPGERVLGKSRAPLCRALLPWIRSRACIGPPVLNPPFHIPSLRLRAPDALQIRAIYQ